MPPELYPIPHPMVPPIPERDDGPRGRTPEPGSARSLLTRRDLRILETVAHYDTLMRKQIYRVLADLFSRDRDGRVVRKRLHVLSHDLGLLNRTSMRVVNPRVAGGTSAPVYYPSAAGMAFLNEGREEGPGRLVLNTTCPNWVFLYHFVAVAETHITLDAAAALRPDVRVLEWYGERSLLDPKASAPEKKYRLYECVSGDAKARVVCVPDAAFLLERGEHRKVFYLEQDRDTTKSAERVAASKCGGYSGLHTRQFHRTQFPAANAERFTVLMLAPGVKRRDALRAAVKKHPGADLWRFASLTDVTAATFLSGPIWFPCEGEPKPLVSGSES